MLLNAPGRKPVYRLRPGTKLDSYGDPVDDWANPVRVRLPGAKVEHAETVEEDNVVRRVLRDERVLFVPGSPELAASDRVEVDGETWRVNGTPNRRRGLASSAYTTAVLTQTTA